MEHHIRFQVIDKQTGKEPDLEQLAMEEWATGLIWCDMEGFAIDQEGELLLMDECGQYRYPPQDRFEVVFRKE